MSAFMGLPATPEQAQVEAFLESTYYDLWAELQRREAAKPRSWPDAELIPGRDLEDE